MFQELPSPSLDLFDLDEHFSSEKVRLAQITNKCMSPYTQFDQAFTVHAEYCRTEIARTSFYLYLLMCTIA